MFVKMISSEKADMKAFFICEEPNGICEKRKAEKNNWKGLHFRLAADIIFL
ncbi:hypothetical protein ABE902_01760 [Enterococcus casseliflavus]|uniref:hypothetical protein n=1 Tax=Enterococcus casseliflavus TaxID=37734 RepID=UPI003D6B9AE2